MGVTAALLDTSVVIALARGELDDLPGRLDDRAVSAVTIAGLHHGVLVSPPERLAGRLRTLQFVQSTCDVLDVDQRVASEYGRVAADARRVLGRRVKLGDGLIAATAVVHGLRLYTRDGDLDGLPGVDAVRL
jgi:predicted nucleic acid-binding protein